jgi:formylglycine-generating enzyme required for sulfatase activity
MTTPIPSRLLAVLVSALPSWACFSPLVSPLPEGGSTEGGTGSSTSSADETGTTVEAPGTEGDTTEAGGSSTSGGPEPECGPADDSPCPEGRYCVSGECADPPDGMVAVPAGSTWIGCNEIADDDCLDDEHPFHEVILDAFAIDRTEVTVADYMACVDAGQCSSPDATNAFGNPCTLGPTPEHPMTCVDWFAASNYCEQHGKRLPTEAEWEKAARGDSGQLYPWGDDNPSCDEAVMNECRDTSTQPVGSKPAGASPYGALDMGGNVFEWVSDWYAAAYYVESPLENPTGPGTGTRRVIRSAGPNYPDEAMRTSFRGVDHEVPTPDGAAVVVGFRCVFAPE